MAHMSQQKLIHCDGKKLAVYDLDEPLMVIEASRPYALKDNGWRIVSNDMARDCLRNYLQTGNVQVISKAKK